MREALKVSQNDVRGTGAERRTSWGVLLAEISVCYILIYLSIYFNLPHHEYLRFLTLVPVYQAAVCYGYTGGVIGGIIVSLLFVPVIPQDPAIQSDRYGMYSALTLLVVINTFGIVVGGVIGRSRRMRRNVHRLSQLSLAIAQETDETGVMRRLAAACMELVEARRAALLLRVPGIEDPAQWTLLHVTPEGEFNLDSFAPDHPLVWCARRREPLATNSVAADGRFLPVDENEGSVQSLIAVPVASADSVYGALMVVDKSSGDQFTNNDLSMMRLLSRSAEAAISNIGQERRRQEEQLREEQMKELFGRFVSSSVADYVLDNPELLQGRWQEITVLVSDIRDFTRISEMLSPREIVDQLNEYFTCMVDIIFENRGTIDKFIGDCIIAYWGAPAPDESHARHAAETAVSMAAALDELNARWSEQGRTPFHTGIGLHTCKVLMGNLGDDRKKVFTILGSEVQKAMNLESFTKVFNARIVVSEEAALRLDGAIPLTKLPAHECSEVGALFKVET